MKKKVNILLMLIASLAILLSLVCVSFVFYKAFEKQIMSDLEITAQIYKQISVEQISEIEQDESIKNTIRVSIISPKGEVIYDNNALVGAMDNHADREEIRETIQNGKGQSIRKSETLDKSLYYYAVLLENGNVLRVAKEVNNILSIFYHSIPLVSALIILLFALCIVIARYFTKKLLEPIEYLAKNLGEEKKIETYPELTPFMNMIYKQHEDIMKSARMR